MSDYATGPAFAEPDPRDAEIADLKHDIERYISINADLCTDAAAKDGEIARLRAERADLHDLALSRLVEINMLLEQINNLRAERDAALAKIREHNEAMDAECSTRDCLNPKVSHKRVLRQEGWVCRDCPRHHRIEVAP